MREIMRFWSALWCRNSKAAMASVAIFLAAIQPGTADAGNVTQFKGICNASAGVGLTDDLFVVVDDEDKVMNKRLEIKPLPFRLYSLRQPGAPISVGELPGIFTNPVKTNPVNAENVSGELDLEASAPLKGLVFWIGSHSAGKGGMPAPNRRRLFAVRFDLNGQQLRVTPVGRAYETLLEDLAKDARYDQFMLEEAAKQDSKTPGAKTPGAKTPGGLSIEGMTALPSGALAIGFRNPVPDEQALVATLLNPMQVIESQKARFGPPIRLDLGGQGIRGMETVQNTVLIVGGPATDPIKNAQGTGSLPPHRLYRWTGNGQTKPLPLAKPDLSALFVEGIFTLRNQLMLVSDDGKMQLGEKQCQDLGKEDKEEQRFRGVAGPQPAN